MTAEEVCYLEQRAAEALEIAKSGRFPTMQLLLEARCLISRFRSRPGVGLPEIEDFLRRADAAIFGDSMDG